MIRALVSGVLYKTPEQRVSKNGKPFTTGKVRADSSQGTAVWCNIVAFGEQAERLAMLKAGAAIAISGKAELSAYTDRTGDPAPNLSLVVDELASLKPRPKPANPVTAPVDRLPFDDALPDWT